MHRPRMYRSKNDFMLPRVQGKTVLDLGCVDYGQGLQDAPAWLHGAMHAHAAKIVGLDCDAKGAAPLQARGYDIRLADAETFNLGERFEVVVAGDIIEHLTNFGSFLDMVREHMTPEGECLLTTPVAVNFMRFMELVFTGEVFAHHEHTCWFTPGVLAESCRRHGLQMVETAYVNDARLYYKLTSWWLLPRLVDVLLCRLNPAYCETMCAVLRHA